MSSFQFKVTHSDKVKQSTVNQQKLMDHSCFNPFMHGVSLNQLANSVGLDQTPQEAASDQGLHCLH